MVFVLFTCCCSARLFVRHIRFQCKTVDPLRTCWTPTPTAAHYAALATTQSTQATTVRPPAPRILWQRCAPSPAMPMVSGPWFRSQGCPQESCRTSAVRNNPAFFSSHLVFHSRPSAPPLCLLASSLSLCLPPFCSLFVHGSLFLPVCFSSLPFFLKRKTYETSTGLEEKIVHRILVRKQERRWGKKRKEAEKI